MKSNACTVDEYVASLPEDRRAAIGAVRQVILDNLPDGYEETMSYGMIGYVVPHSLYPPGYHCNPKEPLPFANLASQKNHMAIYLSGLYGNSEMEERFRAAYLAMGKRPDIGKGCIRFKKLEELPLDLVGAVIAGVPVEAHIARHEEIRTALKK